LDNLGTEWRTILKLYYEWGERGWVLVKSQRFRFLGFQFFASDLSTS